MTCARLFVAVAVLLVSAGCRAPEAPPAPPTASTEPATPPAVNGWREYPLSEGVLGIQPGRWRTDAIDVPVPTGKGLEYKLTMKKGESLVYNISYPDLAQPGQMVVEFHGHTPQVDGVGDLMFYSKGGGTAQSGTFTAPWDGIHGWYLKNESGKDVVVKLELAGFYVPLLK